MGLMRRSLTAGAVLAMATFAFIPAASATIHPIVESVDCANTTANEHHPLGDVAEVPGVTPGYGHHSTQSDLRSLIATSDGLTDFSSPAWFGHKLDGECGHSGP
ncbi:hypothetical protein ACIPVK_03265 [Paeniglutamicibacter sp. MACA_103]|uniref:hypothetical protein n=1 Tax=Paeniglutamicibacter sp. MACA_103 TaxID=3377337 RepID=UPI003893E7F1